MRWSTLALQPPLLGETLGVRHEKIPDQVMTTTACFCLVLFRNYYKVSLEILYLCRVCAVLCCRLPIGPGPRLGASFSGYTSRTHESVSGGQVTD